MMNQKCGLSIVFLWAHLSFALEATQIKFDDLGAMVSQKNQHVRSSASQLRAVESGTGYLLRSYLPKLTLTGGYEKFRTGNYSELTQPYGSAQASLNLFKGGKDLLENKLRNESVELANSQFHHTLHEELLDARKEFWQLIYQREALKLLEDSFSQNEKNLLSAKKRVSAGFGAETDRYEFDINKNQLLQDIQRMNLAISNSQRNLAVLLGLPADAELKTVQQIEHEHTDELFTAQLNAGDHHDVKSISSNQAISQLRRSQFNRWWMPSLDAYASHSLFTFREREYATTRDRYETVVGVKLTLELFDGFISSNEAKVAAHQAQAFEEESFQTARELEAKFEAAKQEFKLTHELIHGAEQMVEQSHKYLLGTLSEYNRGVKNSLDALSASQRHLELQRRLAELKRDYQISRAGLLALLGK